MTLRLRLILLFSVTAFLALFTFATFLYFSSAQQRETEFFSSLEKEAQTKADLFFTAQVPSSTLHAIYESNRQTIFEVEVAIYALPFDLIYHDAVEIDFVKETPEMIETIANQGTAHFFQNDWQIIGMPYEHDGVKYIITAAAYDEYGYNKLKSQQRSSLLLIFIFSGVLLGIGIAFAHFSLRPLRRMTKEISEIQVSGLNQPISAGKFNDELYHLAEIFNNLLQRLHQSFHAQKEVVAHMSHEFRTPLAALMMEVEMAKETYKEDKNLQHILNSIYADAEKMRLLAESLINLAKAQYDESEIDKVLFRVDELLLETQVELMQSSPNYSVSMHYDTFPEATNTYEWVGNPYLMKQAFLNLIENACKYSADNSCEIRLGLKEHQIEIKFIDHGIGISAEDTEHLFKPFYRVENNQSEGFGIGLALTAQIIQLHESKISVASTPGKDSTFTILLNPFQSSY